MRHAAGRVADAVLELARNYARPAGKYLNNGTFAPLMVCDRVDARASYRLSDQEDS